MAAVKKFGFILAFLTGVTSAGLVQAGELPDFAALAESAGPSVVNISTKQQRKRRPPMSRGMPQTPQGSPFDDFFRHFFGGPGAPGGHDGSIAPAKSLGSGFIISADGYLLTIITLLMEPMKLLCGSVIGESMLLNWLVPMLAVISQY